MGLGEEGKTASIDDGGKLGLVGADEGGETGGKDAGEDVGLL